MIKERGSIWIQAEENNNRPTLHHESTIQHFERQSTLYTCFVDFANYNLLWIKLATMGLSARMLKILQTMYGKATSRVVANETMSPTFHCLKGVRHGCKLRPLLFCLYTSDLGIPLDISWTTRKLSSSSSRTRWLTRIMNALQTSIDLLEEYCSTWDLKIKPKPFHAIGKRKRSTQF